MAKMIFLKEGEKSKKTRIKTRKYFTFYNFSLLLNLVLMGYAWLIWKHII